MINQVLAQKVQDIVLLTKDMPCWYVFAGKGTGSSFSLALGRKIPLDPPLNNTLLSEEARNYQGESNLLVWCAWRLDGPSEAVTSSDEADEIIADKLEVLVGETIRSIEILPPAWDMRVAFSNDLQLHVFCDHVPGDPSFDGNWDFRIRDYGVYAGPGYRLRVMYKGQGPESE